MPKLEKPRKTNPKERNGKKNPPPSKHLEKSHRGQGEYVEGDGSRAGWGRHSPKGAPRGRDLRNDPEAEEMVDPRARRNDIGEFRKSPDE